MEAVTRKPFQGVVNIIRFNWHFYVFATVSAVLLLVAAYRIGELMFLPCIILAVGIFASLSGSLFVSYYVYDRSGLYDFTWLPQFNTSGIRNVVNIHAGFDETSVILKINFPETALQVFDFYDPFRHTEVSIERAQKAYPPYNGTIKIVTSELPLAGGSIDLIFNFFALHEVRNANERIHFLKEQSRVLRHGGKILIVEHLRDLPNFLAYNIGFFHFVCENDWKENFEQAGLCIDNKFKITPFVTVFILRKAHGITP